MNKIFSKKTSLIRVVNQEVDLLNKIYNQKIECRNKFVTMKEERDRVSSNYKLIPLESIFQIINQGHLLVNKENADIELHQQALLLFLETTKDLLTSKIDSHSRLKIKYSSISSKLNTYEMNTYSIKAKENDIESNKTKIVKLEEKIEGLKAKIKDDEESKANIVRNQEYNIFIRKHLRLLGEIKQKHKQESIDIESLKLQLPIAQSEFTESSNELDTFFKLKKEHEILDSEISQVINKKDALNKLYPLQTEWVLLEKQISDIEGRNIPDYEKSKSELTVERQKIESDQIKNMIKIDQTNEIINKHLEGANAIQSSINNIARYLPTDQGKCPVCNTEYKPEELQKQIKIALELMNPAAHKMTQTLKEFEDTQKGLINRLSIVVSNINELNGKITHERASLESAKRKLTDILISFPNCNNANLALQFISSSLDNQISIHNQLLGKKKVLKDMPTENTITDTRIKSEKIRIEFEKLKSEIQAKESVIKVLLEEVARLEEKTKGSSLEKLYADISKLELEIETSTKLNLENNKIQESLHKELNDLKTELHTINDLLLQIKSQQSQIETEWLEAELQDKPSEKSLQVAKSNIESRQKKCSESLVQLEVVQQQLVAWKEAEHFNELNKKVKAECGEHTEDGYLALLSTRVVKQEKKLMEMKNKQKTMTFLFEKVDSELKQMNKYVESINQPWCELLQRTIVNSRFSTGELLKSKTIRNKPTAGIGALLNGYNTPVDQIASEAQLTDLQLTFMLAMAKQHHWTPWRALLLDDPTQHHDLVHASSVFDLLRDYISDLDFQVMLSTHDSQQANFFRRKLENDGIENKIYRLKAGNDGVFADLL